MLGLDNLSMLYLERVYRHWIGKLKVTPKQSLFSGLFGLFSQI